MTCEGIGLKYEMIPCHLLRPCEVEEFVDEFAKNNEAVNVLWELDCVSTIEWLNKIEAQDKTLYGAFLVDDRLVGVCRITKKPNHCENGMVGIYIRPTERRKGYATMFLRMIAEYGRRNNVHELTACVNQMNVASIRLFLGCGWHLTGRIFDWIPDPEPRKALEFAL